MEYPLQSNERTAGTLLGAPVIVKGLTWLPVNQIIFWAVMSWTTFRAHPGWPRSKILAAGGLNMGVFLGSEWLHNLAHAAAARAIGKPVDAVRIFMGMPLLVYLPENDRGVTPGQHILRALGGPLFNAGLLALAACFQRFTQPGTIARGAADTAVWMNTLLCTASLLPIPGIDGGPILKWSLVKSGKTPPQADELVVKFNRVTAVGLGLGSAVSLKKHHWLTGTMLALFAALSLLIGTGILKEDNAAAIWKDKR